MVLVNIPRRSKCNATVLYPASEGKGTAQLVFQVNFSGHHFYKILRT